MGSILNIFPSADAATATEFVQRDIHQYLPKIKEQKLFYLKVSLPFPIGSSWIYASYFVGITSRKGRGSRDRVPAAAKIHHSLPILPPAHFSSLPTQKFHHSSPSPAHSLSASAPSTGLFPQHFHG